MLRLIGAFGAVVKARTLLTQTIGKLSVSGICFNSMDAVNCLDVKKNIPLKVSLIPRHFPSLHNGHFSREAWLLCRSSCGD